jgi:hypothetical protein
MARCQLATPGAETVGVPLRTVATSAFNSPSVSLMISHGPVTPSGTWATLPQDAVLLLAQVYLGPPRASSWRTLMATIAPPGWRTGMSRPSAGPKTTRPLASRKPGTVSRRSRSCWLSSPSVAWRRRPASAVR